jgi:acyl carrier protein
MSTLGLVNFVEEHFGVVLEAHETGIEHFDRIEDIAALVTRKQQASA